MEEVRLTRYSHGAGCACKLGPGDLAKVMGRFDAAIDPALLVGTATGDDAAVYRIDERTALVFTADFFTPIVDDAYDWGRIAAANALSDVYAMGGRPVLCLNLVCWPSETVPLDVLSTVLGGGADVARSAGAMVVGGHTIDDPEPKYGMAVVGFADPQRLMRNDAAASGDVLFLTKPIGVGVISTAIKRGQASDEAIKSAVEVMTALNASAAEAAVAAGVRGATDITGFGLLGHLHKMLLASGVGATLRAGSVLVIEDAPALVEAGMVSGGTRRNIAFTRPWTSFDDGVDETTRVLLADAQTSGGLLVSCPAGSVDDLRREFAARGVSGVEIGVVEPAVAGRISISA